VLGDGVLGNGVLGDTLKVPFGRFCGIKSTKIATD